MRLVNWMAVLAALFLCPVSAKADTLASYTGGEDSAFNFQGESFTTAAGVTEDDIVFNFYSNFPATTPTAFGTGYLLSQEYLGAPDGLSSGTAGYLGKAAASGGYYTFASTLTLAPDTQYFFYENGSGGLATGGAPGIAGGNNFYAISSDSAFVYNGGGEATNFLVQGTPVVPELGANPLLALCLAVGTLLLFSDDRQETPRDFTPR